MIVDEKPIVMGSFAVTDDNGYTIMTIYVADKNGFKPVSKVSFSVKDQNRRNLLRSAVGGK